MFHNDLRLKIPEQNAKVIKAKDFWGYRHVQDITHEALLRQENIVHAAESAYLTEKQRGYKEGLDAAHSEHALSMMDIINKTVNYTINTEQEFSMLVYDAVKQVIGDYDNKCKVIAVVKSAMSAMRGQKHIVLKVNPENIPYLESEMNILQRLYPMVNHIEMTGHSEISLDTCIVVTEIGSAEASITAQMNAVRISLARVFDSESCIQSHNTNRAYPDGAMP